MAKRRSNGEGAIYQTKDGRWRAAVDLGWKGGKRDRKYLSGPTKAAVARKVREALAQVDAGVPLTRDGRGPTVEEWLWYWFDNVAVPTSASQHEGRPANAHPAAPGVGARPSTASRPDPGARRDAPDHSA